MAWITKNSGTMQIERRDEPYLTDDMKAQYTKEFLPRYETKHGALLPVLHDLQHHVGWIPHQAMEEIAAFLEITPAQVLDTVSFYEEFHAEPVGKYIIGVCQSIACEACGHETLVDHVRTRLGIEPEETTADGLFTLRCMECIGSCDTAPCGLINEDRHDLLTIDDLDRFIDEVLSRESKTPSEEAVAASTPE